MASKTKKGSKPHNSVHVKGSEDLVELGDFLKKNKKVTIYVIIMMEGCPHCVTLEKDIVNPLLNNSSRKAGMALIQHDQLENTPLKHLASKVRGYPTMLKVVNENAEEVKNPRDLKAMETAVGINDTEPEETNADPDSLNNNENLKESLPLNDSSSKVRSGNVMSAQNIKSLIKMPKNRNSVNVPNVKDDVLNSQDPGSMDVEFQDVSSKKDTKDPVIGGSLYASLLEAGKDLAPAIALTAAAVASRIAISRKKTKKHKGGSRRKRRSRRH